MAQDVMVTPDQVSLGVLVTAVPRDAVDDAIAVCGIGAKRSDGTLPPHVVAYLTMALCLFTEDDYTEVATKVTGSLDRWGCWKRGVERADRQRDHPGPETVGPSGVSRDLRTDLWSGGR